MLIGKRGPAVTSIGTADPRSVTVRGRNLTAEFVFTESFVLLLAELGLVPNNAPRMTYAADPVLPGTADLYGKFLLEAKIVTAERAPIGFLMASHAEDAISYEPWGGS